MYNDKAMKKNNKELVIAIPKGFLHEGTHKYLLSLGINLEPISSNRELVFYDKKKNVKGLLVRPNDVSVYVEHGSADIGIVGLDLVKEQVPDVIKLKDLNFGHCKLVLAVKKHSPYKRIKDLPENCKIATKFLRITNEFIHKNGLVSEVIKLYGSVELSPIVELTDAIVDLVATGKTLKANNLIPIETILKSSAVLIANIVSFRFKKEKINLFWDATFW